MSRIGNPYDIPASDRMVTRQDNGGPAFDPFEDDTILRRAQPRLIAFTGTAGSGKTTAADIVMGAGGFVRVKFADALKAMLRSLYEVAGFDADEIERKIEGDLKEVPCPTLRGQTPRHAMVTLGTEWGRDLIASDLWVSIWKRKVRKMMDLGFSVVVDDLRFDNELAAIREIGGTTVRVLRPATTAANPSHISEQAAFEVDFEFVNRGSRLDLGNALCAAFNL